MWDKIASAASNVASSTTSAIVQGADPATAAGQALLASAGEAVKDTIKPTTTAEADTGLSAEELAAAEGSGEENPYLGTQLGEQTAGVGTDTIGAAKLETMPGLKPREGETAGEITSSVHEGETFYQREFSGTTKSGKPYSYIAQYDPNDPETPVWYHINESASGDPQKIGEPIVVSSQKQGLILKKKGRRGLKPT